MPNLFRSSLRPCLWVVALGALGAFAFSGSAGATIFLGDLVYCDMNADGIYNDGDVPLDGVVINVQCKTVTDADCAPISTITGGISPGAMAQLGEYNNACPVELAWDPTDPEEDLSGRYLVEVFSSCNGVDGYQERPYTCTVTVDPESLPADCNQAVTPRTGGFPFDENSDGDLCDDDGVPTPDGPFVEGETIGNLDSSSGCEEFPDPLPVTNQYTAVFVGVAPGTLGPDNDRCSPHNDFGYTGEPDDEEGPTRTPGFWKNHPGAIANFLPFEFCGETISDPCDAVALLDTGGGGLNQFIRHGVAAYLNCAAWGCSDTIADLIAAGSEACADGDAEFNYGGAGTLLDIFNNSGDNLGQNPPGFNDDKKLCKDPGNGKN